MMANDLERFYELLERKYYYGLSSREKLFVAATKLAGEAGEVMEEINGFYGYKPVKDDPYSIESIAEELADTYIALHFIAAKLDIDVQVAVASKLAKNLNNKKLVDI